MLRLYQYQLTDKEANHVNRGTPTGNRIWKRYNQKRDGIEAVATLLDQYKHVATIYTNDLERAFEICNFWKWPELVTRYSGRVASLSVGDLLVDEKGNVWYCGSYTWEKMPVRDTDMF